MIPPEDLVAGIMVGLLVIVMVVVPWLVSGAPKSELLPDREARLWVALGIVQVTIWGTLGPAQTLAMWLRIRGMLGPALTATLGLAVFLGVGLWLRRRPGVVEVVAAIGIASTYLMLLVRAELPPAERTHLFEYGLVAVLGYEALLERRRNDRPVPPPWPTALLLALGLGVVDEALQYIVPGRVFDPADILFNSVAVTIAMTSVAVMAWARRAVRERRATR